LRAIVSAQDNAETAIGSTLVARFHGDAFAGVFSSGDALINDRKPLDNFTRPELERDLALCVQRDAIGAREAHADAGWVGSRSQVEVVFELRALTVVNHVNARIHLLAAQARIRVGGMIRAAREVVRRRLLFAGAFETGGVFRSVKTDANDTVAQPQSGLGIAESNRKAVAARAPAAGSLLFEAQGQGIQEGAGGIGSGRKYTDPQDRSV
jgi:hypothetical protein